MAIETVTRSQLQATLLSRLETIAFQSGLELRQSKHDDWTFFFHEKGSKHHTSQISVDFEFSRYYRSSPNSDPRVQTFVVSGKFMPAKETSARGASQPWDYRYTKTKDYAKAIDLLRDATRKEDPYERVERLAFEAQGRWHCVDWERRRVSASTVALAVAAEVRDGRLPVFVGGTDSEADSVAREISTILQEIDRYVGGWMAVEIIDISRKHELGMIERGVA